MRLLCLFFYCSISFIFFFFFNNTATTEIYTLSLHDALPIFGLALGDFTSGSLAQIFKSRRKIALSFILRSEEHTSELQSRRDLVCRLLLEKKKNSALGETVTFAKFTSEFLS